jgi:energy-coupling factor transport system ATP-binding protein
MSIELKKVCCAYEGEEVLSDVTLSIADGEFVGVMGHTGCGKSTLLQLLCGLLRPCAGTVLLDGADINARSYDRRHLRQSVGMVFQYPECQLFEDTVEKDVAFGLKHSGLRKDEIEERVHQALELMEFDVDAIRTQSPLSLSGGERRRVAIAGVLAAGPKILLFDEPVAGLDPYGRHSFLRLVTHLNEQGVTIVMVSHNANALSECAKRLVVLSGGRVVLDGDARAAFRDEEALRALGLETGTAQRIIALLRKRGMDLPADCVTYQELLSALRERGVSACP